MEFGIAGKAFQIIENNHVIAALLRIQIAQQIDHAGAVHEIARAGNIVGKDRLDIIALVFRVITAAAFLAFQARALGFLFSR